MKSKVLLFGVLCFFSHMAFATPVNVNSATSEEVAAALKGIGMTKAQRIVEYCKESKCSKPEDLLAVKGIGEKTLAKISDDLRFED